MKRESFVVTHDLVLVDGWSEWCGPFEQQEQVVETLAAASVECMAGFQSESGLRETLSQYR